MISSSQHLKNPFQNDLILSAQESVKMQLIYDSTYSSLFCFETQICDPPSLSSTSIKSPKDSTQIVKTVPNTSSSGSGSSQFSMNSRLLATSGYHSLRSSKFGFQNRSFLQHTQGKFTSKMTLLQIASPIKTPISSKLIFGS